MTNANCLSTPKGNGRGVLRCPLFWLSLASALFLRLFRLSVMPPGLHFDEAVYAMMAQRITEGHFPVFFPSYTGREPLFMYLVAAVFLFTGATSFGLRLTAALIGVATVPVVYFLFRELFSHRVGLLAMALVATSYWHLSVNRTGFPWNLLPFMGALALYFLWRGYMDDKVWGWIGGGLCTGLFLYVYLAARLFPVTLLMLLAYLWWADRPRFRSRLKGILLAIAVAAIAFAPLGFYYLQHPHDFWERANQVMLFKQVRGMRALSLMVTNTLETALVFLPHLDPRWRYSLVGKPLFDPLLAPFFFLGVALALRRWRRPEYALLPIWLFGMSLPAILTANPMPQAHRMFGIIPPVYGLVALGMDAALEWWRRSGRGLFSWRTAVALILVGEGLISSAYYFYYHGSLNQNTLYIFDGDYVLMAEAAWQEMNAGHEVVIFSEHYKHPSMVFVRPRVLSARWVVGPKTLVFPSSSEKETVYLRPAVHNPLREEVLELLRETTEGPETISGPQGQPAVMVYRLRGSPDPQAIEGFELDEGLTFNGEVRLLGHSLPEMAPRDQPLKVLVNWQVLRSVPQARTFALHLLDENGVLWAQTDEMSYLSEQWRPGDTVFQWFDLLIDPAMPAGPYRVCLLLADEHGSPLPVMDEKGELKGIFAVLGEVTFLPEGAQRQPIRQEGTLFGDTLRLLSYQPIELRVTPGGKFQVTALWQALQRASGNPQVIIELCDVAGQVWARYAFPLAPHYPLSSWQPGEVVRTRHLVKLGPDAPVGRSFVRLRLEGFDPVLVVGTIYVEAEGRLFEPPAIQHPLQATLGGRILLLGYDMPRMEYRPGETIPLKLYWQALEDGKGHYKVFTHLLDSNSLIWGQHDGVPASGKRPTEGWMRGEIIVDSHPILISPDAPSGRYIVEIGMYDPLTMERLEVRGADGRVLPDARIIIAEVTITR